MISKVEPISGSVKHHYLEAYELAAKEADKICERAMYVLSLICNIFEVEQVLFFYFGGAEEERAGWPHFDEDSLSYIAEWKCSKPDISTSEWDFSERMPTKYLFMSDEQVRTDVKRQLKKDEEKRKALEERNVRQDARTRALIESAASKLTPQERKILGI